MFSIGSGVNTEARDEIFSPGILVSDYDIGGDRSDHRLDQAEPSPLPIFGRWDVRAGTPRVALRMLGRNFSRGGLLGRSFSQSRLLFLPKCSLKDIPKPSQKIYLCD